MNTENQTLLDKAKEYAKNFPDKNYRGIYLVEAYLAGAENNGLTGVPYQKCPKCDGQGSVSKPPWIAGDVNEWSSTSAIHVCDVCNGAKIIPQILSPVNEEREKEVELLRAKVEFYRTATDKVRELVSNSPDIGAPCQPLYDAIEDKLNENTARIKELEEALRRAISTIEMECDDLELINELQNTLNKH